MEFGATQLFVTQVVSYIEKKLVDGNSLEVHWLGLGTSTAWGMGSIPGWGTKIPRASEHGEKRERFANMSNHGTLFTIFVFKKLFSLKCYVTV